VFIVFVKSNSYFLFFFNRKSKNEGGVHYSTLSSFERKKKRIEMIFFFPFL